MAVEVTESTFETEVIGSEGKVIVDFWAEWCGPCHAVAPVLDRIADERDLKIVKVNIDHEQGLAQRYGVSSIPMMVLFEGGEPQASAVGAYRRVRSSGRSGSATTNRGRAELRTVEGGRSLTRGRRVVQVARKRGAWRGTPRSPRPRSLDPLVDPGSRQVVLDPVEVSALVHESIIRPVGRPS